MGRKLSTEEFVSMAKSIHGDKYDYSLVDYVCSHCKVTIICRKHGEFEQPPNTHLSKKGCPSCGFERSASCKRMSQNEFIRRAVERHGGKFDYSLVDYRNSVTPVIVVCPIHGQFLQSPYGHLTKEHGCEKCSYSSGCRKKSIPFAEFLSRARERHGDLYEYHEESYSSIKRKTMITCRSHGDWWADASSHVSGKGCPNCNRSRGELSIKRWLTENGVEFKEEAMFDGLGLMKFDFYLPRHNLLIEFDGKQHFKAMKRFGGQEGFESLRVRDEKKNRWAWENGYMLMRIPYWMQERIPELLHCQLTMFCTETAA